MRVLKADNLKLSDIPQLHFASPKTWRNRGKHSRLYKQELCAFDIETTVISEINQSVMYVWQFAIGTDLVIIGRTWDEFKNLVKLLRAICGNHKLIVYVHNLSYEFQFLSGIHVFLNDDVFCPDSRKILRADWDCLEFRCSYYLTNLSLKELTRRYGVQHQKIDGDLFDYSVQRFAWSPLSDLEKQYIINDVIGLLESIRAIMDLYQDDVYTLPLTATGFVRRICRENMRPDRRLIQDIYPIYEVFQMLRAEFRGGNTHANRYYAGEVIRGLIHSKDIASSYPTVQCNCQYPITAFRPVKNLSAKKIDMLIDRGYAVLFEVEFYNIHLRNKYSPVPYIPIAKCSYYNNIVNDNGRILSATECHCVLNDIDWQIIVAQYTFSCRITRAYYADYGPLPDGLQAANREFFRLKTELKGIDGQELYYQKNKELLNSIYGLSVQNPAKASILYEDCLYTEDHSKTEEELLQAAKKKAFIAYQFGCWTTAHARAALEEGINICGDGLIYVDTDSCKYIGDADFTEYNDRIRERSTASGLVALDKKGLPHYGGVYETESDMQAFITQGAKKYAYEDLTGKIHLTVSGVGKRAGAAALEAAGGLAQFQPGFVFHNCGKTASVYNDGYFGPYNIDGHTIDITRNVVIEEKDYTLSRTKIYDCVLEDAKLFLSKSMEILKNSTMKQNI